MNDHQLLEAAAQAAGTIHDVGNACMFREQCRAMAARIVELEAALRPFAAEFKRWDGLGCWDAMPIGQMCYEGEDDMQITFADLRRAAAACGPRQPEGKSGAVSELHTGDHGGLVGGEVQEVPDGQS
ncbi:hypothetical protein [Achromobacter aloeverae]